MLLLQFQIKYGRCHLPEEVKKVKSDPELKKYFMVADRLKITIQEVLDMKNEPL